MYWFPKGIWRYAVVIILLLVLAAVASMSTLRFIERSLIHRGHMGSAADLHEAFQVITWLMLSLTMGFLFLSGALGIWAIRSIAQIEGRRRVGRFVDAMDYLSDGLFALDRRGRITGSNSAARDLASREPTAREDLAGLFPSLSREQVDLLLNRSGPQEVECVSRDARGLRALRFRSQPSEDMILVLVSDITGKKAEEMRSHQTAHLQLIGRIARGVAHDFNNILCAISGHAELVGRGALATEQARSLRAIQSEAQRGAALAAQVLGMSRAGARGRPCVLLEDHLKKAADLLKVGLSHAWQVVGDIQGPFEPTIVTDSQVEQLIVNLGLLAADSIGRPGFVQIRARPPSDLEPLFDAGRHDAAVVWISASAAAPSTEPPVSAGFSRQSPALEAGVVQSVARSILDEVGGRLDILARGTQPGYRLYLPILTGEGEELLSLAALSDTLRAAITEWRVLLACEARVARDDWERQFRELGMEVRTADDIVNALQEVEAGRELSVMVLQVGLLGEEAGALLRAIRKLRPQTGLVLLAETSLPLAADLKAEVLTNRDAPAGTVLQAMIRSVERIRGGGQRPPG